MLPSSRVIVGPPASKLGKGTRLRWATQLLLLGFALCNLAARRANAPLEWGALKDDAVTVTVNDIGPHHDRSLLGLEVEFRGGLLAVPVSAALQVVVEALLLKFGAVHKECRANADPDGSFFI